MKCAVQVCTNTTENFPTFFDESGAQVCPMCKITFNFIRKYDIDIRL